jgi:hypothetical protein
MSIIQGNAHTSAGGGGYQIERSLRFNSADSAYLDKTWGVAPTSTTTATISVWVKRTGLGSQEIIRCDAVNTSKLAFQSDNTLILQTNASSGASNTVITTQVFRDVSAWYHIVWSMNNSTGTWNLYVNGVQVSAFSTNSPTTGGTAILFTGNGNTLKIAGSNYFNGYMTEMNFIDGQALTPSDFGETDSATGVWKPKAYTGTYGTNGFYLNFSDNASTTTLGDDFSGNGNDWTTNNFSVTAGAGNDSLVDSPTPYGTDTGVGGEVRGNYATFNPLNQKMAAGTTTLSNGNLTATNNASSYGVGGIGTVAVTSGKWYCEVTATNISATATSQAVGIVDTSKAYNDYTGYWYRCDGQKSTDIVNGTGLTAYGNTYTTADVIGVALDMDAGEVKFYKNGTVQNSGTAAYTGLSGALSIAVGDGGNVPTYVFDLNAGQRPFAYTAPSGFKALCTTNLPTPTIGATSTTQANDYFNVVTYTGNGTAIGSGGLTINSLDFQPDLVWVKSRSDAYSHNLYDAVRGATKKLSSDATTAENIQTEGVTSFTADGFTLGNLANVNESTKTYVAWNWNAGGSNATNTSGTITSTVRANTTSGFSIVTYTGTGSNATVGHGLGVAPQMIICMNRGGGNYFPVYHVTNTASKTQWLQITNAASSDTAYWQGVTPTTSVFSIGTNTNVNANGNTYVAYCFAPVAGYSAFGSYTGNGSADGTFVYTNHRPAFLLVKRTDTTSNWTILDFQREGYNVDNDPLFPNLNNAEGTTDLADILSNGFKLRSTDASVNASGGTYIYMSLASNPFKYSLGR